MSGTNIPDSPQLPTAEVEIPDTQISAQLTAALDLDSDSDDEDDVEMVDVTVKTPINNFQQFEHADSLPSTPDVLGNNVLSRTVPKDPNYIPPMMDFSDPVKAPIDVINPFGSNHTLSSSYPVPISLEQSVVPKLTDLQEQKLGEYIEEKLMVVQKGFVKYLSSKSEAKREGMTWTELVTKLDEIVEFIWYSIFQLKGIPVVYHTNILIDSSLKVIFQEQYQMMKPRLDLANKSPSRILMQTDELNLARKVHDSIFVSFLVRILGDFADFVEKYDFQSFESWIMLLRLAAKLDNMFSIIIDYSIKTSTQLINITEKVRIASIIQRTKITTVSQFETFTSTFDVEKVAHYRTAIETFQTFVGELYEGIVDRTSA